MEVRFSAGAWQEYTEWQSTDKKTLRRINELLKDISRGGNDGIGKPEPLRNDLSGFWSRRIDDKNRLVYSVSDDLSYCEFIQCKGHYS